MDEPFGALDSLTRGADAGTAGLRLGTRRPKRIFFITHSIEEALFLGTQVLVDVAAARPRRSPLRSGLRPAALPATGDARSIKAVDRSSRSLREEIRGHSSSSADDYQERGVSDITRHTTARHPRLRDRRSKLVKMASFGVGETADGRRSALATGVGRLSALWWLVAELDLVPHLFLPRSWGGPHSGRRTSIATAMRVRPCRAYLAPACSASSLAAISRGSGGHSAWAC